MRSTSAPAIARPTTEPLADVPDQQDDANERFGFLVEPDHRHDFNRIVVYPETVTAIQAGISKVLKREAIERVFRISQIEPRTRRTVLNFYGPPGTGKTLSAIAVARQLRKPLYQVDYSAIVSRWVGSTAKRIKKSFEEAREHDAVLFFDEADSLLSRRIDMGDSNQSFATSINQNRNVLMAQLDLFDGVVIMATNLFKNFDDAFIRRIAQHVPFKLPDAAMRKRLFKAHLPERTRQIDWEPLLLTTRTFSGGDILNVVLNAIGRVTLDDNEANWWITGEHLVFEAQLIRQAKLEHQGHNEA